MNNMTDNLLLYRDIIYVSQLSWLSYIMYVLKKLPIAQKCNLFSKHESNAMLSQCHVMFTVCNNVCKCVRVKGYFHSTMLMQALRKGFLRVKRKRDLAGRGLPPVACSFFSFSLCFLFSSSSFMMTGLAASALAAILMSPPEISSRSWKKCVFLQYNPKLKHSKLPVVKAPGVARLVILCGLPCRPLSPTSPLPWTLCPSHRVKGLSSWLRASDRKSPLGREK